MELQLTVVLLQPFPSLSIETETLFMDLVLLIGDVINTDCEQYRIIPLGPEN